MADEIKTEEKKEKPERALGMPEGSIRGLIALITLAITGYMLLASVTVPEWFTVLVTAIITFYYGKK